MAERLFRDTTHSIKVDTLSVHAEVFFYRLMMKVDDYGCHPANAKLLNGVLFQLKDYRDKQISSWIDECVTANLIVLYQADGREYLQILDFGQKLRRMKHTYPTPDGQAADNERTSDGQVTDNVRPEVEEGRRKKEEEAEVEDAALLWPTFDDFWEKYSKKVDRLKCEKKWKNVPQADREKIMEHLERYIRSTPDVKFRKDPSTYLNNQSWNNEIVSNGTAKITRDDRNSYFDAKYGSQGAAAK